MAAHRYWRLLLAGNNPNSRAAVAEVQMRGSVAGANLCSGGTILSSGTSSGLTASNAFDGNTATEWNSQIVVGPFWIGYDFSSAVDVQEVSILSTTNSSMQSGWGYLQWSDDSVTWTVLAPRLSMGTASTAYLFSGFAAIAPAVLVGSVALLPTAWPSGPVGGRVLDAPLRFDPTDGGPLHISGDVAIEATPIVPVSRRVLLFAADSYRLVRSTWSDSVTGAYSFPNLRLQKYIVLTRDHTRFYNAVVADEITPVA